MASIDISRVKIGSAVLAAPSSKSVKSVSGKGSNFAIFSVNRGWPLQLLYYRTTVIPASFAMWDKSSDVKPRCLASASRPKNLTSASWAWPRSRLLPRPRGSWPRSRSRGSWHRPREVRPRALRHLDTILETRRIAARVYNAKLRKVRIDILFEIKTVFLDFWIFSIANGELMIETVFGVTVTLLFTFMDARKIKSWMLWRTIIYTVTVTLLSTMACF